MRTKLHQVVSNAAHYGVALDETVETINSELRRLAEDGHDVAEWMIPESKLTVSSGYRTLLSGENVPVRRMNYAEFLEYSSPMVAYLDREVARRRQKLTSKNLAPPNPPSDRSEVWVIHGRDEPLRKAIFGLLLEVRLNPIEFETAVTRSGSGSPIILDVVLREINNAPAIVALLSPDDYAELRDELRAEPKDIVEHKDAGFQPRPNVILETGMALARLRDRTILVTRGQLREISDILGVHAIRWDGTAQKRNALINRLNALGCPVDRSGSDWLGES